MADKNCQVIEDVERQWCDALCSRDLDQLADLVRTGRERIGCGLQVVGPSIWREGVRGVGRGGARRPWARWKSASATRNSASAAL